MKRFLVFAGEDYYPRGGFNDLVSDHDSMEEAKAAGEQALNRSLNPSSSESTKCREHQTPVMHWSMNASWAQIVDHTTGEWLELTPPLSFCPQCESEPSYPNWSVAA